MFTDAYLINRQDRPDRLREMRKNFAQIGWGVNTTVYPAIVPYDAAGFPSPAVRGCYLSHLEVLRDARERRLSRVLIVEDDAEIGRGFSDRARSLADLTWHIAFFGHSQHDRKAPGPWRSIAPSAEIRLLHCYAVVQEIYDPLIAHLLACTVRPPGSPEGGPMHVDGALCWFRRQSPDVVTIASAPAVAYQRASRSDLNPKVYDRIPGLRQIVNAGRQVRRLVANAP